MESANSEQPLSGGNGANSAAPSAGAGHPPESIRETRVGDQGFVQSLDVTDQDWSTWSAGDGSIVIVQEVDADDPASQTGLVDFQGMDGENPHPLAAHGDSGHPVDRSSGSLGVEQPTTSSGEPAVVVQILTVSSSELGQLLGGGVEPLRENETLGTAKTPEEVDGAMEEQRRATEQLAAEMGRDEEDVVDMAWSASSADEHAQGNSAGDFRHDSMSGTEYVKVEVEDSPCEEGPHPPSAGHQGSTGDVLPSHSQEEHRYAMENAAKSLLETVRDLGRRINERSMVESQNPPTGVPPHTQGDHGSAVSYGGHTGLVSGGAMQSGAGVLGTDNAGDPTAPSESSDEPERIYVTGQPGDEGDVVIQRDMEGRPVQMLGDSKLFHEAAKKLGQIMGEQGVEFAFTCPVCHKEFGSAAAVRRHSRRHYQEKPHECAQCGKKFFRKGHCERHEASCKAKPFKCGLCRCTRFNTEEALKEHMVRHRNRPGYKCELCGATYLQPRGLKEHRRSRHPETLPKEGERRDGSLMECEHCQETFRDIEALREHVKSQHSEADKAFRFKCDFCPQFFSTRRGRLVHYRTTHKTGNREEAAKQNKTHQCDLCGKMMAENNAEYHRRTHSGERPFNCGWCEKRFTSKQNLKEHMRVHSGEKPFRCRYCPDTFTASGSRVRHERKHTGEMPYSCGFCEKRFRSISGHEVHERTHTGATPYKCRYCPRSFTYKYKLDRHTASSHEDEQEMEVQGITMPEPAPFKPEEGLASIHEDEPEPVLQASTSS